MADFASAQIFAEEPIAFGLSAVVVNMIIPEDVEGVLEKVENRLNELEEIGQIQTLGVNRL